MVEPSAGENNENTIMLDSARKAEQRLYQKTRLPATRTKPPEWKTPAAGQNKDIAILADPAACENTDAAIMLDTVKWPEQRNRHIGVRVAGENNEIAILVETGRRPEHRCCHSGGPIAGEKTMPP